MDSETLIAMIDCFLQFTSNFYVITVNFTQFKSGGEKMKRGLENEVDPSAVGIVDKIRVFKGT